MILNSENMFKKNTLIRTIYLYTFSLVGLVLVVIGGVQLVNMGLKAWVFTQADEEQRVWQKQPPMPVIAEKRVETAVKEGVIKELTQDEKIAMENWLATYNTWKKQQETFDPVTAQRHRDAASSMSFILVGLPLYLFHWRTIRKEKESLTENNEVSV